MTAYLASIAPALANHLWQSTLFAMAVWLVTLLLRGNRAALHYRLWLAASIKFLVPFSLLIGLGHLLPKAPNAVMPMQPGLYSTVDILAQPFLDMTTPQAASTAHVAGLGERLAAALPSLLVPIWLAGAAVVLLVWLARWRQVSRTLERAVLAEDGREWQLLRQVDTRLPLLLSQESMEPGIFGVFRPVLLWPERLSARLDDEHIEAILLHELMHVWRRDNLTAALHMLIEAIFWFHPLVWWIERRMVEERERACDEAVIQMGGSAEAYAESLVKACRFCVESPLTCVSGITGADLNQRIIAIMQHKLGGRLGLGKALLLVAMGVGVVAGPLVFGQVDTALHAAIHASPKLLSAPPPPPPPPPRLSFEVVSIRQSVAASGPVRFEQTPDGYRSIGLPMFAILQNAYAPSNESGPLRGDRIVGAPNWLSGERYDVVAKVDPANLADWQRPQLKQAMLRSMLQTMLAERFKAAVHHENKELPVYDLVIAKGGPKFKQSEIVDIDELKKKYPSGGRVTGGGLAVRVPNGTQFYGISMAWLAQSALPSVAGRPVVDKTGLTGLYDFMLPSAAEPPQPNAPPPDDESVFTVLPRALGLRLEPAKGQVEMLVIDHIERPSEN